MRACADLCDVVAAHTRLNHRGAVWAAKCPLHSDKAASLRVAPQIGVYYCFGCGNHGDAAGFVSTVEGISYDQAARRLARRYGADITATAADRKLSLSAAVADAAAFYHQTLLDGSDAAQAREYLAGRGYSADLIEMWQIGWAPRGWDHLVSTLERSEEDVRAAGLGFVNSIGRLTDFFRGRVMFPICDEYGHMVGFGARALPGDSDPKYINTSAESEIYDKSSVLYGLHQCRNEIVASGRVVICEGYTDVIGCVAASAGPAVAACGTALTEQHLRTLSRFSVDTVVLALDADKAGADAVERIWAMRPAGVELLMAALPAASDPGDLATSDPQALRDAVAGAEPLAGHRVSRTLAQADLSTIEGRAAAAALAAKAAAAHPDPVAKDRWVAHAAHVCGVDLGELRAVAADAEQPSSTARAPAAGAAPRRPVLGPQQEALRAAIHDAAHQLDGLLHPALFTGEARQAYNAWQASGRDLAAAAAAAPAVSDLLCMLAVEPASGDPFDALAALVAASAAEAVKGLMAAAASSPEAAAQCAPAVGWLKGRSEALYNGQRRHDALKEVLPWLVEYWQTSPGPAHSPAGADP